MKYVKMQAYEVYEMYNKNRIVLHGYLLVYEYARNNTHDKLWTKIDCQKMFLLYMCIKNRSNAHK
jgi:hypothetical protein